MLAPVSETDVPDVCAQEYVMESPFGSVPEPFRVTDAPGATVWFGPASAVGD